MSQRYDAVSLFEGLNRQQAERFRDEIFPTLQELRRQITGESDRQPLDPTLKEIIGDLLDSMDRNLAEFEAGKIMPEAANMQYKNLDMQLRAQVDLFALQTAIENKRKKDHGEK